MRRRRVSLKVRPGDRLGIISWIRDHLFGGSDEEPTPQPPGGGDSGGDSGGGGGGGGDDFGGFFGEGEQDLPHADTVPFDFHLAGFLELGSDFKSDYVNTEGQAIDVNSDIPWTDLDYIVVRITEPNGSSYYTTFVGPFDDYDDFFLDLEAWWEEGSP